MGKPEIVSIVALPADVIISILASIIDTSTVEVVAVPPGTTEDERSIDIKESIERKEHFELNELDYVEKRDWICILPAHEIFKAVVEKFKSEPNRYEM